MDEYCKLLSKPQLVKKVDIQLPYGIKGISHGEAYTWFEDAQNFATGSTCDGRQFAPFDNDEVLLQHQEMEVIRNEIMVFHRHPQPIVQNPQPYIEEMWKKMKLQHKYSKVLFALLERTLSNDFFKEKIHMNMSKDPPFDEFNKVLEK